jgi:hypothetical protein
MNIDAARMFAKARRTSEFTTGDDPSSRRPKSVKESSLALAEIRQAARLGCVHNDRASVHLVERRSRAFLRC